MKKYTILNSDSEEKVPTRLNKIHKKPKVKSQNGSQDTDTKTYNPPPNFGPSTKSKEEILYWIITAKAPCLYYYQNGIVGQDANNASNSSCVGSTSFFKHSTKENLSSTAQLTRHSSTERNLENNTSNHWDFDRNFQNHNATSSDKKNTYQNDLLACGDDKRLYLSSNSLHKQLKISNNEHLDVSSYIPDDNLKKNKDFEPNDINRINLMKDYDSGSSVLTSHYIKSVTNDNRLKKNVRYPSIKTRRKNILNENKQSKTKIFKPDALDDEFSTKSKENLFDNVSDQSPKSEREKCRLMNNKFIEKNYTRNVNHARLNSSYESLIDPISSSSLDKRFCFQKSNKKNLDESDNPIYNTYSNNVYKKNQSSANSNVFNPGREFRNDYNEINLPTSKGIVHVENSSITVLECGNKVMQIVKQKKIYTEQL